MGRVCLLLLAAVLLPGAPGASGAGQVVVTTTDFSSGSLASVDAATHAAETDLLNVHGDTAVRTHRGRVYVINRKGQDNILVLDPESLATPLLQFSVGNDTNPQDIAFHGSSKAYVARLEASSLLVVNPSTGDSLGSIDLTFAADDDGFSEPAFLATYGGRLYVTCQRLNQDAFFSVTDHSVIVVVDLSTDTVVDLDDASDGVQGIRLTSLNPSAQARVGSRLFLSCTGQYGVEDGGIEVVDLSTNQTLGIAVSEGALAGDVGAIAMASADRGYVVVSDASFVNTIKPFDVNAASVGAALSGTSGGYTPALLAAGGALYIADRGSFSDPALAGLLVFRLSDASLVAGPVSTGLPPNALAYVGESDWADADVDGDVDFSDFLAFARSYGSGVGSESWDPAFDSDGDASIDFDDFLALVAVYGK